MNTPLNNHHSTFEYNQIDQYIWIGTNQCCEMHFDQNLLIKGIKNDISLEEDRVDAPFGATSYLWLPTPDENPPTLEQLKLGVAHIEMLISQKRKMYIHCKNGHGRAPTLVASYYSVHGKTVEEAVAFIKSKRPEIHLNELQIQAVHEFRKIIL